MFSYLPFYPYKLLPLDILKKKKYSSLQREDIILLLKKHGAFGKDYKQANSRYVHTLIACDNRHMQTLCKILMF